ncbi:MULTISPECIES: tRNA (N6-threonylcarbamoyladenosine(37)-N6)-methyltransferase TrmO [Desulfococcus]|jgi:tRNA-Thr(GGU) m(6)t(6)A37 methyltransferase TsaA|uniref:TsaA-like domain-containing protein n=1 Tax=Desulfococcus multivorans DSM 2059 TaxID=1121405 RepID=S7V7F5_DESML|nr:tRNA (N6-threonylcarbamoyladenosine(37)-N6)-methyltransferase TrmO [Desulfococcus multivorans]AOY58341.1 conserved uncharacterized protein, UPF0066 [Desulfococcus multivorans]AQV00672.1 tRNA (N6-threonylcarbamoyladenosine(37)-N6)-methyltransferase TrmO [Desulfococcus multivorans]EPR42584.1 putative protein family UPF0066 [Desulfococcus multivorans DSM 2059]MDX9817954.1 tRNA (N6-threonylcarbamoyladenosine(37)-N6)-methyltransferase TrmO [Desulfococcus multivorans]SKA18258.1 tRNA-Thr(GGU) m(6)
METIEYRPIGIIHTPFNCPEGTPIQPPGGLDHCGVVEVFSEFHEGLRDVEGFSHLILLYHCHLAGAARLTVMPFLDDAAHGLFATRAPARPNAIGLSVVRLLRVEEGRLYIREVDIVDGTPLLDIKPYVPKFDSRSPERTGWLEKQAHRTEQARDDGRFSDR